MTQTLKLNTLRLTNFRGIEALKVDFTEQTTAFVGINGVGKSTVLEALAIAFSQLTWRIMGHPNRARPIAMDDIRHNAEFARIEVDATLLGEAVTWGLALNRRKGNYTDPNRKSDLDALNRAVKRLTEEWQKAMTEEKPYNLPLVVYYDVNRAVLDIPVRIREQLRNTPSEVYSDALDHGGADFKRFFIWFRNREDYENEQRRDQAAFRDPALEAVRSAISVFTDFRELRIRRNPLRMTVLKQGQELNVAQLSDGERNMLALVGDLARRLSILNPGLGNANEGCGLVLIDEIDLHLHPGWQRTVVASLRNTFENCRFVITTHSPQVVGELVGESVMLMKSGRFLGHAERALGLSSGDVLEELMEGDARNQVIADQLKLIQRLIDEDKISDAKLHLETLKGQVGDIPEVLHAESAIESLKWLEEEA
jgi:predicted ATP-binding protein involved in virulence